MADSLVTKQCVTCREWSAAVQGHHVVPLCYGGKEEGVTVDLCSNCHTTVHRLIENPNIKPPRSMIRIVAVGRLAKQRFLAGELEAKDRRPTLLIPMDENDTAVLEFLKRKFNTKSKAETVLHAMRWAALNVDRVR